MTFTYTFVTDPRFWDCDCTKFFIHAKVVGTYCPMCVKHEPDQPDSRANEISRGGLFASDDDWQEAYNLPEYHDELEAYEVRSILKSKAIGHKAVNGIQRLRVSLHSYLPTALSEKGSQELTVTIRRLGVDKIYYPLPSTLESLKRVLYRVKARELVVQFGKNEDGGAYCETIYYIPVVSKGVEGSE